MIKLQFKQLSEGAVFVVVSDTINEQAQQLIQHYIVQLKQKPFPGLLEIVPSYTNFCVYYDPILVTKSLKTPFTKTSAEKVKQYIEELLTTVDITTDHNTRVIEIPVHYGGVEGPDLQYVAEVNGLTPEEVIAIHTSKEYIVYMLGFAPGFPFLGGLDKRITTPRRTSPRLEIVAGSVGIAGEQTGIYPLATPGGWQIIGRTTLPLFLPNETPPTLLRAGDRIKFIAVKEVSS
ncbi:5-oxoprolinase subunit PxpB [Solibacillus sp. FSL R7-0682]|uniref:5-oxoprolinase subunit PxpB n=1 Tax=Solibacillus sp. FSL R7-0682 TaxID=2921690 RepID=UPI0030F67024